jgi:soluble lytic murein transglycosylase-like protein
MSIEQVIARIQELAPAPQPAQTTVDTTATTQQASFADALAQASDTSATDDPAAPYRPAISAAAERYGIDESLLESVIAQESGFDPNATSAAGAQGLMQLMPQTAASLGVTNPYDPAQAIDGGARYLGEKLQAYGGDASLALAAYNAGSGAVDRYGVVPPYPETQNYVQQVLARAERLHSERSGR